MAEGGLGTFSPDTKEQAPQGQPAGCGPALMQERGSFGDSAQGSLGSRLRA